MGESGWIYRLMRFIVAYVCQVVFPGIAGHHFLGAYQNANPTGWTTNASALQTQGYHTAKLNDLGRIILTLSRQREGQDAWQPSC